MDPSRAIPRSDILLPPAIRDVFVSHSDVDKRVSEISYILKNDQHVQEQLREWTQTNSRLIDDSPELKKINKEFYQIRPVISTRTDRGPQLDPDDEYIRNQLVLLSNNVITPQECYARLNKGTLFNRLHHPDFQKVVSPIMQTLSPDEIRGFYQEVAFDGRDIPKRALQFLVPVIKNWEKKISLHF